MFFRPNNICAALGAQAVAQRAVVARFVGIGAIVADVTSVGTPSNSNVAPAFIGLGQPSALVAPGYDVAPSFVGIGSFETDVEVSAGAHRYWRINVTANDGDASYLGLLEAEFRGDIFGQNLAVGGTAASSSNTSPYFPAKAFDSSFADRSGLNNSWATNAIPTGWLSYDFGMPVTINEVMLFSRGDGVSAHTQSPKDFDVQSSDDNSIWVTEWSVTGATGWVNCEGRVFTRTGFTRSYSGSPYGAHSYWRVTSLVYNGGAGALVCASEIEFRATPSGADQASGGTPSASSIFSGGFPASAAFANDGGTTFWASGAEGGQSWIQYHFAAPVEVAEVLYKARADSSADQSPRDFIISFSDDGTNWTTAWYHAGETAWSLGEIRIFTDPNYI